jgi:SWI/SNF-related matrix-associated actin-dependent regulator of chromatin subfamily A member 5
MPEPYHLGEHVIASSSKLIAIDKLLADILPTGDRVLIFSVRPSQLVLVMSVPDICLPSNGLGVKLHSSFLCYSLFYFHRMLDMLEDFLAFRSIPYARLDGSTNRPRRTLDIKLVSQSS